MLFSVSRKRELPPRCVTLVTLDLNERTNSLSKYIYINYGLNMLIMCQKATSALGEPPLSVTALHFQRSEIRINTEALCGVCVVDSWLTASPGLSQTDQTLGWVGLHTCGAEQSWHPG